MSQRPQTHRQDTTDVVIFQGSEVQNPRNYVCIWLNDEGQAQGFLNVPTYNPQAVREMVEHVLSATHHLHDHLRELAPFTARDHAVQAAVETVLAHSH